MGAPEEEMEENYSNDQKPKPEEPAVTPAPAEPAPKEEA
jgi:hypothetical protein